MFFFFLVDAKIVKKNNICSKVCYYLLKSVLLFAQKCAVVCSKVSCYLLKSMVSFAQKCAVICSKVCCYLLKSVL